MDRSEGGTFNARHNTAARSGGQSAIGERRRGKKRGRRSSGDGIASRSGVFYLRGQYELFGKSDSFAFLRLVLELADKVRRGFFVNANPSFPQSSLPLVTITLAAAVVVIYCRRSDAEKKRKGRKGGRGGQGRYARMNHILGQVGWRRRLHGQKRRVGSF